MKNTFILFILFLIKEILVNVQINDNYIEASITNEIWIGENHYRFINFANFSDGTMIVEVSSELGNKNRIFFGLKPDGNYLFDKNDKGLYEITLTAGNNKRQYAENFCVKINNKEYISSISNEDQYLELYNFETGEVYQKLSSNIVEHKISSIILSSLNFLKDGKNYILFSYFTYNKTYAFYQIQQFEFESITDMNNPNIKLIKSTPFELKYEETIISNSTSCFISDSQKIWCFGLIWEKGRIVEFNYDNNTGSYYILLYHSDLTHFHSYVIDDSPFDANIFYKIAYLRQEICVIIYYSYDNNNILIPKMIIGYLNQTNEIESYTSQIPYNIQYDSITFNSHCLLNDLIRVSEYMVSFSSVDINKEIIYITLIEIYEKDDVYWRTYQISEYQKYKRKILFDLKLHLFCQKFIVLGSGFCKSENCNEQSDDISSAIFPLSYANSSDNYLNLTEYSNNDVNFNIGNIDINLTKYVKIDNNIFGYKFSSIQITDLIGCENIILYSQANNYKIIEKDSELVENEIIKISFKNDKYQSFNCSIFFRYIITEADISESLQYIRAYYSSNDKYVNYYNTYIKNNTYEGKISFFNIIYDYKEPFYKTTIPIYQAETEYKDPSTILKGQTTLIEKQIETTIKITTTKTEYIPETILFNKKITEKIVVPEPKIETDKKVEEKKEEEKKYCTNDEVLNNECGSRIVTITQIREIFNVFRENVQTFNPQESNMQIIQTDNVIIQIILINDQDLNNPNMSFVNIGECENILKSIYNIPKNESLIMIKSDIKNDDSYFTSVQFELYHPRTKEKLNMSYCDDVQIQINIPTTLENNTIDLYDSLLDSGYNLFDSSDSFYNDACSTYTSTNGTDMILSDRQNIIYSQSGNISLCQTGCNFVSYNKTMKSVQCDCNTKSTSTDESSDKISEKEFKNSFVSTILNSNFIILKCVKMVFSAEHIFTNKGRIAMTIIIFFFFAVILIIFVNDKNTINKYFKLILEKKLKRHSNNLSNISDNPKTINENSNSKSSRNKKMENNINEKYSIKNDNDEIKDTLIINKIKIGQPKKQYNINNKTSPKKKENKSKSNKHNSSNFNFFNSMIRQSKEELNKINIISEKKMQERLKIEEKSVVKNNIKEIKEIENDNEIDYDMNDEELNSLEYEKALEYDKRTLFQYYWSLLKKNQIILFTFVPANDYNLVSLKMVLFILSLSLEITINGFFFTDETIHQIHEDNGEFDLVYQIPQILYSSIISTIINTLLQKLALSEDSFLAIKQTKEFDKAIKQSESIKKCLKIKFIIFFIISFILMLFCWYYISSFCGVYINTQSILFKDTLISLLLSMFYPFGLCLLPGICRIPALQDENKDKKCLYKLSGFCEEIIG